MEIIPSFLSPSITTYPPLAFSRPMIISSLASSLNFGRRIIEISTL